MRAQESAQRLGLEHWGLRSGVELGLRLGGVLQRVKVRVLTKSLNLSQLKLNPIPKLRIELSKSALGVTINLT